MTELSNRPGNRPGNQPGSRPGVRRHVSRRAFTLIELLIVIAILLAILGLVVVNLLPAKAGADADLTRVQIGSMTEALRRFNLDLGRYPLEEEGVRVLWTSADLDEEDIARWRGPYLEKPVPTDPWGNEWIYRAPSELVEGMPYDIVSLGPDQEEGTPDDLHNHLGIMGADGELREGFEDFNSGDTGDGAF